MTQSQKDALAFQALGLLNEQVQARIVHYRGDLETSAELDAITAQVVAQLRVMQAAVATAGEARKSPEEMEEQQLRILTNLLGRVFHDGSSFVTSSLKPIGHRVAKLFFESELHEKTKGDKERRIYHPEQGVFYLLQRHKHRMRAELELFEYESDAVRQASFALLDRTERDLQVAFLSRRSPELQRVLAIFSRVLTEFLTRHVPPRVEAMARITVRAAETARRSNSVGYKVWPDAFPQFRTEWERVFMQQMVNYCGDCLFARLREQGGEFREETVKFFTDPELFSASGAVLCDALYDFLCLEGFLDLPMDWRVQHGRES